MMVRSVELVFPLNADELAVIREHVGREPSDEDIRTYLLQAAQEKLDGALRARGLLGDEE